jgi:hypothetical protein
MTKSAQTEPDETGTATTVPAQRDLGRGDLGPDESGPVFKTRHATLRYTTLRLGLFLAALGVVWVIAKIADMDLNSQTSKLSLLAVAIFVSSAVSFVVLSKQRDAMSAGLVARSQKLSQKLDQAASFEDE